MLWHQYLLTPDTDGVMSVRGYNGMVCNAEGAMAGAGHYFDQSDAFAQAEEQQSCRAREFGSWIIRPIVP